MRLEPLSQEQDANLNQAGGALQEIQEALRGLRYGTVTVIVQDGLVVQVERLEKRRLAQGSSRR